MVTTNWDWKRNKEFIFVAKLTRMILNKKFNANYKAWINVFYTLKLA